MAEATPPVRRFHWVTRHIPTRETVGEYRLLRPFAARLSHPSLWRMTRRSVPRGVAIGLFVAVLIPFMHTVIAALLAIPARANVAVAALFTLVVNPLTIPPLYYGAYRIGSWELHHDAAIVDPADAERFSSELSRMLFWVHHASGSIAVGVLTIAIALGAFGYFGSGIAWRFWCANRWRRRRSANS
ncbi:MAG TPA: DUF2062 domain-containing protein [Sphingomicrobium sp.]|nr:DUF2062 domain-containing protein [Sphingomicrobium sp.]